MKTKNKIFLYYLLMIIFHFGHVLEEAWGGFWMVNVVGPRMFLFINWLLFSIPAMLLYFVILDRRTAYHLSIVYAVFMALNGVGHNIGILVSGKYSGGFAGSYSGLGLIVFGTLLAIHLYKNIPRKTRDNTYRKRPA